MVEGLQSPEAIHAMMFTWNYFAKVYKYEDENGDDRKVYVTVETEFDEGDLEEQEIYETA